MGEVIIRLTQIMKSKQRAEKQLNKVRNTDKETRGGSCIGQERRMGEMRSQLVVSCPPDSCPPGAAAKKRRNVVRHDTD